MQTNRWFVPLLLILGMIPVHAQNDISYYKDLANNSDPDLQIVAIDSVLSKSKEVDTDTYIEYSLRYIDLSLKLDSIEQAARQATRIHYTINSVQNQPRQGLDLINKVLAYEDKINNPYLRARLYQKRGGSYFKLDITKAIDDYNRAFELFTDNDSIHIADTYLWRGQAYSTLGKFVPAGDDYRQAFAIYEALDDHEYMFYVRQGITTMFSMNGFYKKAMAERQENIELIKSLGLNHHLPTEYYNQSLDYRRIGNIAKYREYLFLAQDAIDYLRDKNLDVSNETFIYNELVDFYSDQGDLETAKKYLQLIEENYRASQDDLLTALHYYGANARFNLAKGDSQRAFDFAREKLRVATELNIEESILDSNKLLAEIAKELGYYEQGLEYSTRYADLRDSIYNRGVANSLAYYQTLYETERKEKELAEQTANVQLLERNNETFRRLLWFGGLAALFALGIVLMFRRQRHLKTNKQLQERYSQELLLSQENERRRISKDLHDGLGQQLLVLKNKLIMAGQNESSKLVDRTIDEVRAISRDLHPFQLQELGLTKALEHTINQIDENTTLFISADIDNIDDIFEPEAEVNIYRIVQEGLSNVLKHAGAEAGKVLIRKLSRQVIISIRDNGVGFDFQNEYKNVKSLGLKTLLERTKFLNGNMKISSIRNEGTTMEFQIPIR